MIKRKADIIVSSKSKD